MKDQARSPSSGRAGNKATKPVIVPDAVRETVRPINDWSVAPNLFAQVLDAVEAELAQLATDAFLGLGPRESHGRIRRRITEIVLRVKALRKAYDDETRDTPAD